MPIKEWHAPNAFGHMGSIGDRLFFQNEFEIGRTVVSSFFNTYVFSKLIDRILAMRKEKISSEENANMVVIR